MLITAFFVEIFYPVSRFVICSFCFRTVSGIPRNLYKDFNRVKNCAVKSIWTQGLVSKCLEGGGVLKKQNTQLGREISFWQTKALYDCYKTL